MSGEARVEVTASAKNPRCRIASSPRPSRRSRYALWERSGWLCRRPGQRQTALHNHDAAPERDRELAYGSRADLYPARCAGPLSAHARSRRAVAAGHRSRRHRHRDRRHQPARRAEGRTKQRHRPRGICRARVEVEGAVGRHDHQSVAPPRRFAGLECASGLRWTRASRQRCARFLSSFIAKG